MKFRRFTGRDAREALARVQAALGSEAIILKNRAIPEGVEILATSDDPKLAAKLDQDAPTVSDAAQALALPKWAQGVAVPKPSATGAQGKPQVAPEMSTVSFQEYLRERASQPTRELTLAPAEPHLADPQALCFPHPDPRIGNQGLTAAQTFAAAQNFSADQVSAISNGQESSELLNELRSMQGMLASHLSSMAWLDGVRRNPVQTKALRLLMASGFSGGLARRLADRLPLSCNDADARQWLIDRLCKVVQTSKPGQSPIDAGGIIAVTGPTGVGKTTALVKMAAQFSLRHGIDSVGLVSVDAFRVGIQEPLRAYGRLLGLTVMVAHDAPSLADFLHVHQRKKLVLIDTVGFGQNDTRLPEQLRSLDRASIKRLLVLSATAQAEVNERVISAFRGQGLAGAIISKVDESVKCATVLDSLIRHRLPIVGVSDGQRVPEDWQQADPKNLVERALSLSSAEGVELDDQEMTLLLQDAGAAHALHA